VLEKVPAEHSTQEDAPVFAWYLPSTQLEQLDWPLSDWKVPAPQLAHEVDLGAEYVPLAQGKQLDALVTAA